MSDHHGYEPRHPAAAMLICLRCFNGIPDEWVTRYSLRQSDGAVGNAYCMACEGLVRVGQGVEDDP